MDKKDAYKSLLELKKDNPWIFSGKGIKLSKEEIEYYTAVILLELDKEKKNNPEKFRETSHSRLIPAKKDVPVKDYRGININKKI